MSLNLLGFALAQLGDGLGAFVKVDELDRQSRREYRHEEISEHLDALKVGETVIAIRVTRGDPPREDPKSIDAGLYSVE